MPRLQRRSVAEEIAEDLSRRIFEGHWQPGQRIDAAAKLATEFGVAVATIREAVRLLQARDIVTVRHGSGTYVATPDPAAPEAAWLIDATEKRTYLEVAEARHAIERGLVVLACQRATPEQVDELMKAVADMEASAHEGSAFLTADVRFHTLLAEAAANPSLQALFEQVRAPLRRLIVNVSHHSVDRAEGPISAHRALVEAIRAGDEAAAIVAFEDVHAPTLEFLQELPEESFQTA